MDQERRTETASSALGDMAAAFPAVSLDTWTSVVEKALKGAKIGDRLATRTDDGLIIKPLYTRADWSAGRSGAPGQAPFTRGGRGADTEDLGWDLRQVVDDPRLGEAVAAIAEDLAGGATSLAIRLAGETPWTDGAPWGVSVATLGELETLLREVDLRGAAIALDAGPNAFAAAVALLTLADQRAVPAEDLRGALNVDPLGTLAATGRLGQAVVRAFNDLADLARVVAEKRPGVTTIGVDARLVHSAGGSDAQEIAYALGAGVAYLRMLTERGWSVEMALKQIGFTFAVDSNFFRSIAKLRAARLAWARVTEAAGVSHVPMKIWAEGAFRDLAARDPYVNMLRGTAACFAAACGNADAISVRPFDEALAVPGLFGRRIARNTQLILAEESGLSRVVDPAGGSWYIESLTEELARAAWPIFQEIEAKDGLLHAIVDGTLEHRIAGVRAERAKRIATRKDPITGVSIFPDLNEPMVSRAEIDWSALEREVAARRKAGRTPEADAALKSLSLASVERRVEWAAKSLEAGATFSEVSSAGAPPAESLPKAVPLKPMRRSDMFERLREASDSLPTRPRVFLANLGKPRDYLDRATFARNVFAAGGIEPVGDGGHDDVAALVGAAKASGAPLIVLSSSDDLYQAKGGEALSALKALHPARLYVVAQPDETLTRAGGEEFVRRGIDVHALLQTALTKLGAHLS